MEEKEICPCCDNECYVESMKDINDDNAKAYLCMNCGFTSTTNFIKDSNTFYAVLANSPQFIREFLVDDEKRGIIWIPSSMNYSKGIIYPDLTDEIERELCWTAVKYKLDSEQKPIYNNDKPEIDSMHSFAILEFMDACKFIGLEQQT